MIKFYHLRTKMQAIGLILGLIFMFACNNGEPITKEQMRLNSQNETVKWVVVEYDGCEYLIYDSGHGYSRTYTMTHKGNCKSTAHEKSY